MVPAPLAAGMPLTFGFAALPGAPAGRGIAALTAVFLLTGLGHVLDLAHGHVADFIQVQFRVQALQGQAGPVLSVGKPQLMGGGYLLVAGRAAVNVFLAGSFFFQESQQFFPRLFPAAYHRDGDQLVGREILCQLIAGKDLFQGGGGIFVLQIQGFGPGLTVAVEPYHRAHPVQPVDPQFQGRVHVNAHGEPGGVVEAAARQSHCQQGQAGQQGRRPQPPGRAAVEPLSQEFLGALPQGGIGLNSPKGSLDLIPHSRHLPAVPAASGGNGSEVCKRYSRSCAGSG